MFTLSVCFIIKNEEKTLERILKQVKVFADEIVIVDTGSTDNSIEIARKYTNNVFNFKWCDDFSKARNYSFSKGTKDYLMWLDADDYITADNINKILELKKQDTDTQVFMFKYIMKDKSLNTTLEFFRERIVKNNAGFSWAGFVHEAITPKGKIEQKDIEIEHRKVNHSNPKRNLKLYNIAKKNGIKFSARDQYYYSRELYYNGYFSSSEKEFKKYLKMNNKYLPDITGAHLMLSQIYLVKKDYFKAKNILFEYLKNYTPSNEIMNNLAHIFESNGDISNAIFYYNASFNCEKQTIGFVNTDNHEFIPHVELSRLYYNCGNFSLAKYHHQKAKAIHPNHPSIIFNEQFFN